MKKIFLASVLAIAFLGITASTFAYSTQTLWKAGDIAKFAIPKGYAVDAAGLENKINKDLAFYRKNPTPGYKFHYRYEIYAEQVYAGPYPAFMAPVKIGNVDVYEDVYSVKVKIDGGWLLVKADENTFDLLWTTAFNSKPKAVNTTNYIAVKKVVSKNRAAPKPVTTAKKAITGTVSKYRSTKTSIKTVANKRK
ncbi:MAG: hypothetical protein V1493_01860 [Candidatus Diapherotrites archaeon]